MTAQVIPIQNVYYLLSYAWDHFRDGEQLDIDQTQCPDVQNLLAKLLGEGIHRLATQGIDKEYVSFVEETPRLRGQIQLLESYRRLTHASGRMICEFDELTADTLPNQILKATCQRLLGHSSNLSVKNRDRIVSSRELLSDISSVQLSDRSFYRIQLHRNNRHYRLLLHVCRLLHDLYLPDQQSGKRRFRDLMKEEAIMSTIFEVFVRRFASKHCIDAKVSAMQIKWVGSWDERVEEVLPQMKTDVTLSRPNRKTILDCKFYKKALVTNYGKDRLHSEHLYQLSSYLQNKAHDPRWENVEGILLYPAVNHHLDLAFTLLGHGIQIRSVDLDNDWPTIHSRMLEILS